MDEESKGTLRSIHSRFEGIAIALSEIIMRLERMEKRQISGLERMEERQVKGLEEIKENAPPVLGSFGSSELK